MAFGIVCVWVWFLVSVKKYNNRSIIHEFAFGLGLAISDFRLVQTIIILDSFERVDLNRDIRYIFVLFSNFYFLLLNVFIFQIYLKTWYTRRLYTKSEIYANFVPLKPNLIFRVNEWSKSSSSCTSKIRINHNDKDIALTPAILRLLHISDGFIVDRQCISQQRSWAFDRKTGNLTRLKLLGFPLWKHWKGETNEGTQNFKQYI